MIGVNPGQETAERIDTSANFVHVRHRCHNLRVRATPRLLAATSLFMLALASASPSHAQDRPDAGTPPATPSAQPEGTGTAASEGTEDEVIVVTGFRASLAASLDEKRRANGIIDVIKAEDIADFPDNNLAEAIQRVPGVTITRDQGEGRQITVRGLGPLFTRVRINGMEGQSTTGGADASGGANRTRSVDFNIFASELFNSIVVRKTASADVEEGSLGATVDIAAARPFDYKEPLVLVGSAQLGYNDLSGDVDPRLSGLVSTQLADGKIGILLSAAYAERGIIEEGPSTVRWEPGNVNGGFNATSTLPAGATNFSFFHPRIPRYDSYDYSTERLGLTGSVQFQPTDQTLVTLDALYSRFKSERAEQYLEAISFSRSGAGKPQTVLLPGGVVENNSLVSGTFNKVDVRVESRFDELTTKFQQYDASLHQEFSDAVRLEALAGYSKSKFRNPIQTTVALDAPDVLGYSYDFSHGRFPTLTYGNLDVTDPNKFILGEIRLRPQFVDNIFYVARAELGWDINQALTLKGGVDWKRYEFDSKELRRASETQVPQLAPGQLAGMSDLWKIDGGTPLPGDTPRVFVVPDLDAFDEQLGIYSNTGMFTLQGIENVTARSNWRTVEERDLGAFLQLDYNFPVGSVDVRGNVGARYVKTKQNSTGYTGQGATLELVEVEREYDDFLPAFNIAAELSSNFILRGAIARVLARPDIPIVNPGGSFAISGGNRTFARGNPYIDPTKAWTYDLSAEWYFDKESAIVLALFYKDINSFIATTAQQIPFNELGLPPSLIEGTPVQPTDLFTVTQPVNSDGGTLKGFEIGIQTPFRFLPSFLSNLGVQANYTYVDSDIDYPLTTAADSVVVTQPLINLSKHAANFTLYYEDKRFSLRGSLSYRSGYLQAVPGRNGLSPPNPNAAQPLYNDVEGVHSSLNVDASASFIVNDYITLTVEGVNLTDEYVDQYIDSEADRLSVRHHTGRQFWFGVRFNY